jgi:hypothetical protein
MFIVQSHAACCGSATVPRKQLILPSHLPGYQTRFVPEASTNNHEHLPTFGFIFQFLNIINRRPRVSVVQGYKP